MAPRWFQLIQAQRSRGRTALTIPFLVGCLRSSLPGTLQPQTARNEINALLSSFLEDTPADHAVSIYRCHDIHQPVAIEFYALYSLPGAVGLESRSQRRTTLYVSSEFAHNGTCSLASLSEQLFQELEPAICAGHFSFRSGVYTPFTDEDRTFIETSKYLRRSGNA